MPWKTYFTSKAEDKLFGEDWLKWFKTKILDTKYDMTDVVDVVKGLTHLHAYQKADLLWVLQKNDKMFDGTLGVYPNKTVHIDIDLNAKPVLSRPYLVPWIHVETFKTELDHLVRIGVLHHNKRVNGCHPNSSFQKRRAEYAGSGTYTN